MTKWIDLPRDSWTTAITKVALQELKAESMLIDDGAVVCRSLVVHTPTTKYELQPAYNSQQIHNKYSMMYG